MMVWTMDDHRGDKAFVLVLEVFQMHSHIPYQTMLKQKQRIALILLTG